MGAAGSFTLGCCASSGLSEVDIVQEDAPGSIESPVQDLKSVRTMPGLAASAVAQSPGVAQKANREDKVAEQATSDVCSVQKPPPRKICRFDLPVEPQEREKKTTDTPSTSMSSCSGTPSVFSSSSSSWSVSKTDMVVKQYRASKEARDRVRKFLMSHGFHGVNARRYRFWRFSYPLHCAVKHNDAEMVKLLLRWGADPGSLCSQNRTPHQEAVYRNKNGSHDAVLRILAKARNDGTLPAIDVHRTSWMQPSISHTQWDNFMNELAKDPLISKKSLSTGSFAGSSRPL